MEKEGFSMLSEKWINGAASTISILQLIPLVKRNTDI